MRVIERTPPHADCVTSKSWTRLLRKMKTTRTPHAWQGIWVDLAAKGNIYVLPLTSAAARTLTQARGYLRISWRMKASTARTR